MNDTLFASHFVTTFAKLEPQAQMEDMNESFTSSICARKAVHIFKSFTSSICAKKSFTSSRRSYPWPVPSKSFISSIHAEHNVDANKSFISQAFIPTSAAIIVFTSSMRSYLPSMPNIALTPTNHPNPLCITTNGAYRSKVCIWHAPNPNPCDTAPKHKHRSPFGHQPQIPLTARTR